MDYSNRINWYYDQRMKFGLISIYLKFMVEPIYK